MEHFQYHLGIDLHRKTSYWTLIDQKRRVLYRKTLPTSQEGIRQGLEEMRMCPQKVEAAIEPVSQWGWYGDLLEKSGLTVRLVDVYKTKLIAGSKLKNDKIDALALAELLRASFLPTAYRAPLKTRNLRQFVRHRAFLVRMRSRMRNRIHQILWKHGVLCPYTDILGLRAQVWLKKLNFSSLYQQERDELIALWEELSRRIAVHDAYCRELAGRLQTAQQLMSIPGIGMITALTILAEVGNFLRFARPEQLASFAGLVSSSYSSGEHTRLGHITHRGSVWLRTAMVEATATVNPRWGYLYDFYHRIQEKKGSKVARVALARKILVLCWHLVRKDEFFHAAVGRSDSVKR